MDTFNPLTPPPKWEGLQELGKPALPALAEFIHRCSPDPATRTTTVTQFLASVWQLAGRTMTPRPPSVITVNAHDMIPDSGDLLATQLLASPGSAEPQIYKDGALPFGTPQQAHVAMANALAEKQALGNVTTFTAPRHHQCEELYFAAQRAGFGHGPSRPYAKAWHDVFQLITDREDEMILRLEDKGDRKALHKDVIERARRLCQPHGYGAGLQLVPKHIALSGSLPASEWDTPLAKGLVELGLPLMVLPSLSRSPLAVPNQRILETIAAVVSRAFSAPVEEPANLILDTWFETYGQELRKRLSHLSATYEYTLQKMARQLFPVCLRIASWCGTWSGSNPKQITAVTLDLCEHGMRGLILSTAGLAWHGLGIDAGCPHEKIVRVLEYLRSREPMTKSQLLRGAHLEKEERDRIVECFTAENLIRIEGKVVTATTFAEFAEALHARKDLPEPRDHWAEVSRENESAA